MARCGPLHFLNLPKEIRLAIYAFVFSAPEQSLLASEMRAHFRPLLSCHRIYEEAKDIAFKDLPVLCLPYTATGDESVFDELFIVQRSLTRLDNQVGARLKREIHKLELRWDRSVRREGHELSRVLVWKPYGLQLCCGPAGFDLKSIGLPGIREITFSYDNVWPVKRHVTFSATLSDCLSHHAIIDWAIYNICRGAELESLEISGGDAGSTFVDCLGDSDWLRVMCPHKLDWYLRNTKHRGWKDPHTLSIDINVGKAVKVLTIKLTSTLKLLGTWDDVYKGLARPEPGSSPCRRKFCVCNLFLNSARRTIAELL